MIPTVLGQPRSSDAPVLSVYLNRDGLPSGPRLRELLKVARARSGDLTHDHAMSLRSDVESVEGLASKIDRMAVPAVGVIACHGQGWFEVVELPEQVWDVAVVADKPYLRPIRAAVAPQPTGVAVVERGRVWVFTVHGGAIEKVAQLEEQPQHPKNPDEGLKSNFGGWHGYAERRARGHADAVLQRHVQEAARLLTELDEEHRFGHVVVGGHIEQLDSFTSQLHPSIRSKLAGTFAADPRTLDRGQVRDHASRLVAEARERAELEQIEELLAAAAAGSRAVTGVAPALLGANLAAIDHLLVAGSYTKPGSECPACGWLSRRNGPCPACDAMTVEVDDVVAALVEKVLAVGGSVDHVRVASRLDANGVGARLRFPLPDGV